MKFEEIEKDHSYEKLAQILGISKSGLWLQVNARGFSIKTIKILRETYPGIDIEDLFNNYPRKVQNGKENIT